MAPEASATRRRPRAKSDSHWTRPRSAPPGVSVGRSGSGAFCVAPRRCVGRTRSGHRPRNSSSRTRATAGARRYRGRGPARLIGDLLAQGVERRVAEHAVRTSLAAEGIDPAEAVRALAEKRARQLISLPPTVRKRRLTAFLLRRGFGGQEIRELVEALNF